MIGFAFMRDAARLDRVDHALGDWSLRVADRIPVTTLVADGSTVGLVLGWAICPRRGRMLGSMETIAASGIFETEIYPLLGSYLVILSIDGCEPRIYLDGLGSLSVVFDPQAGMAGGTAADLMDDIAYQQRFDRPLYEALEIKRDGWFPAGLTAHRGLERLMPNHYLDCGSWTAHRHNSYARAELHEQPVETSLDDIQAALAAMVSGILASERDVSVGLTGGGDSRMVLAGIRGYANRVEFYTVGPPVGSTSLFFDLDRAREFSSRFGLDHRLLPFQNATEAQMREWDRRVGDCVITGNQKLHPSVNPLEDRITLGGLGGEVGRCFLWRDMARMPNIDAVTIVDLLKLPRVPELVRRVEAWLDDLPAQRPHHILDLAYTELRMGCWSSPQSYANPREVILPALGSYSVIEAMLTLPPEFRQGDGLVKSFIERFWPELLGLPINRYGDFRDSMVLVKKLMDPTRVYRKVRQKLRAG